MGDVISDDFKAVVALPVCGGDECTSLRSECRHLRQALSAARENERSAMEDWAKALVDWAEDAGFVLTITQRPRPPLAMGNYETVVEVRPARTSTEKVEAT